MKDRSSKSPDNVFCCCGDEHTVHDETAKFKLIDFENIEDTKQRLFDVNLENFGSLSCLVPELFKFR